MSKQMKWIFKKWNARYLCESNIKRHSIYYAMGI